MVGFKSKTKSSLGRAVETAAYSILQADFVLTAHESNDARFSQLLPNLVHSTAVVGTSTRIGLDGGMG